MVTLCLITVGTRFAVRAWRRTWSFWLSDLFLVLAVLFLVILASGDTIVTSNLDPGLADVESEAYAKVRVAPNTHERNSLRHNMGIVEFHGYVHLPSGLLLSTV